VTSRICVSILPRNNIEALDLIKRAEKAKADLIEVRLDYFGTSVDLSALVKSANVSLIATNRTTSEEGFFDGTEVERQHTLLNAAQNGFEYVDVSLSSPKNQETIDELKQYGAEAIVSYHKFDGALRVTEMGKVLEREIALRASVCKIVGTASKVEDNIAIFNFVASHSSKAKLVCFCMGEAGKISRLLSPVFGAFFTYASLEQGSETAEGQISIGEMRAAYDIFGV